MSAPRLTATARLQRLLAILQWAAARPDGVPVDELCQRFRLRPGDLAHELELASMIGADSPHYDDMPFEVFVEDGLVYVRLFSFRRPMRLTPAEGLALVAAADVLVDRGDAGVGDPLARAIDKLAGLLGIAPGEAVDVDLDPDGGPTGAALRRAIAEDVAVAFTYWTYGRDAVGRRVVDPWELFTAEGAWYLAGWAHDAAAPRHFRLDRMEEVEVTEDRRRVLRPDDHRAELGVSAGAPQVVLDLAPSARWVAEAHPVLEAEPAEGDRLRIRLAVEEPVWLARLLVRLGPAASVVEIDPALGPTDLAAREADRILARYGGPSAPR